MIKIGLKLFLHALKIYPKTGLKIIYAFGLNAGSLAMNINPLIFLGGG